MVHLDSTWSSYELHVDYGHKFGRATTKVKCTWSPPGLQKIDLDSSRVHLEKVGQGKVLNFVMTDIYDGAAWEWCYMNTVCEFGNLGSIRDVSQGWRRTQEVNKPSFWPSSYFEHRLVNISFCFYVCD